MAKFKINFKDSNCQYVEDYNAGKYGTKVKIYFCEGDAVTPKGYSGSVGTKTITADTLEELKLKLDRTVANRDKEIAKTLQDKKVKDNFATLTPGTPKFTKAKDTDYVKTLRGEFKVVEKTEKELRKEGYGYHHSSDDGKYKIFTKNNRAVAIKVKDSYDDLEDEWDYEINCEGNQWADSGFETAEEAEDEALAKVNELLEDFPEGYAVDDFEIILRNTSTGEEYTYDSYRVKDSKKKAKDTKIKDSELTRYANTDEQEDTLKKIERVAKSLNFHVRFGTAIGKAPQTIILDHGYQDSLIRVYSNGACEIGRTKIGSWEDDYCEPTTAEIRKAIKLTQETSVRDKKVCDASADEIIDLFHEAYIKGRTWDWLKHKLPPTFLNLKNKRWEELFPIQADRTGKLKGVYLSKPKNLSEQYEELINKFLDAFWGYMRDVEHIETDYDLYTSEDYPANYDYDTMIRRIQETIENTDSKAKSAELDQVKKNLQETFRGLRNIAYQIPGVSTIYLEDYAKQMLKGKGDYGNLYNYLINQINDNYRNKDYQNNQRKPIIYNKEGDYIRSDSKVGPLTPEAEAYIRKIMGEATTEEIETKRENRYNLKQSIPTYYNWKRSSKGVIPEYGKEMDALNDLLTQLKAEASKEKKLGITLRPDAEELEYVGQGKGNRDYAGNYKYNGSYVNRGKRTGNKVELNIAGLNNLAYALTRALNSENLDVMQENLQEALDVIKTLPRSNPKVAEIKAKIDELLNKRREALVNRRPLPDKKFVKDNVNVTGKAKEFIEELKEFKQFQIDRAKDYNGADYYDSDEDIDIEVGGQDYDNCVDELLDIAQFYDREFDNLTHTIEAKVKNCVEEQMSIFEIVDFLIKDCKKEFSRNIKDSFNKEELKEYMELRRKLGLDTERDVKEFSEAHGNVTDQELLEALRKEANK